MLAQAGIRPVGFVVTTRSTSRGQGYYYGSSEPQEMAAPGGAQPTGAQPAGAQSTGAQAGREQPAQSRSQAAVASNELDEL